MERFTFRKAIERLRDGLSDPVALSRLTIEEQPLLSSFTKGLNALDKGKSSHLCISGSYGQGKTHNLAYLSKEALVKGYAVASAQLDPREMPFHQLPLIYQQLMKNLILPDGTKFTEAWQKVGSTCSEEVMSSLPYRFQIALRAMLAANIPLLKQPKGKKTLDPSHYSSCLEKVLCGHTISLPIFKQILKARGFEKSSIHSLNCRGNIPYIEMVEALGRLLKEMGYKGLVLFFDEGESIIQGRVTSRIKSYEMLNRFFKSENCVYPIFAFTEDFFEKIKGEDYESEKAIFPLNYSEEWKDLNIIRLSEASAKMWQALQLRLTQLYSDAYNLDLSNQMDGIKKKLQKSLDKLQGHDTRLKLKALVHQLDIETQDQLLACRP